MIRICGRCGRRFKLMDLVVVLMPGEIDRHYVFCPPHEARL